MGRMREKTLFVMQNQRHHQQHQQLATHVLQSRRTVTARKKHSSSLLPSRPAFTRCRFKRTATVRRMESRRESPQLLAVGSIKCKSWMRAIAKRMKLPLLGLAFTKCRLWKAAIA